jgi:hypothetical protein
MPFPDRAQALARTAGLALCFLLISFAFRAKEFGSALPNQQDSINYIRTVHQCVEAIRSGDYFPRLSTYDAGGKGYPFFQFYPPASFLIPGYVCACLVHNEQAAINATISLLYLAMGFAVVALGRDLGLRRGPAVVGAFALLTYPYLTHVSILNIPMFFGLCGDCLLLAAAAAFARRPTAGTGALVFLATAALCLTHFLSCVLYLPCLVVLLPFLVSGAQEPRTRRRKGLLALAGVGLVALGLLACAFQLGPMVDYGLHRYLRMSNLLNSPQVMAEFAERYTTFSNLLSPRLSESNPLSPPFMGEYSFQLGLAYVAGLLLAGRRLALERRGRGVFGVLLLICLGSVALMNPAVVRALPAAFGVFQFPTRFLGLIAVPGALLLAYALDGFWGALGSEGHAAEKEFAATALVAALVVGASSMATQYLVNEDNQALTGFRNPVHLDQILEHPSSTYSEEYLLDAYHFAKKFSDQPLYGGAQYFIYWHRGLAENDQVYPLPLARSIPSGVTLRAEGRVPEGIPLPQVLRIDLNGTPFGTVTLARRDFSFSLAVPPSMRDLQSISYHADRFIDVEGHPMVAQFSRIVFGGFPDEQSVVYWPSFAFQSQWRRGDFVCTIPAVAKDSVYVLPVLAYPGLQKATVNGEPFAPLAIPMNDRAFCGILLHPGQSYEIRVQFSGDPWWNGVALAALACALVAGAALLLRPHSGA